MHNLSPERLRSAVVLVAVSVAVSGCTDLAVRLGLRTRLAGVPVSAVSVALVTRRDHSAVSALGPGQSAQLVIVATNADGQKFVTVGAGGGKVLFDSYVIDASVVNVSKRGRVSLPADPLLSEGRTGHLRITLVGHPGVAAELHIPVRYDIAYQLDFPGADGAPGMDGMAGFDGMPGMDALPAPVDPATGLPGTRGPGGAGSNGGDGGDGSNGQDGWPAANVRIWMRLARAEPDLLQVKVLSGVRQSFFLVDPHGGSLRVLANGGQGGRGGSGGRGGRGGRGGDGFPRGMDGQDGRPGSDGRPGGGGAGGTITVSVDPAAQRYLSCLSWSNRSGDGASGPAKIIVEPVSSLW